MKRKIKGLGLVLAAFTTFALYFMLSLSCATTSSYLSESTGTRSYFPTVETENGNLGYDIVLVSDENSASKIYKVISREDAKTWYSLSLPTGKVAAKNTPNTTPATQKNAKTDTKVTIGDLASLTTITEEDAKAAVEFLSEVERLFVEKRSGTGVLTDFVVTKPVFDTIKVEKSRTVNYYGQVTVEYEDKVVESKKLIFALQLKTTSDADEIVYTVGDVSVSISLDDAKNLKAALSK